MAGIPKIKLAELEIDYKDLLKAQAEIQEQMRATREEMQLLEATQDVLRRAGKQDSEQYQENAKAIELQKVSLNGLKTEYKNNERVLASAASLKNEELGTIQKLDEENKKLRASLRALDLTTTAGQKTQKEYIAQINKNTEFIKKNSDAAIQQKMNIGNYKSALDLLPGSMRNVATGFQTAGNAAKMFLANPVVLVITLIVAAVAGLVKIFKTFDPIIDKIEQGMAALNAVFKVIQSSIINLITGHKGHGESMREAAQAAIELKKAEQDLDDMNMILIASDKKAKRQIDELLLQSKDRTKTEEERQRLIDEAMKIEEEQYKQRKQIADSERSIAENKIIIGRKLSAEEIAQLKEQGVAYAIKLKETKAVTDDEVRALAEAIAKQEEILDESVNIREKAINRRNALEDKAMEDAAKRAREQEALNEKQKEQLDELNAAAKQYYDSVYKAAEAEMLAEVELEKAKIAEKERLRQEELEKQKAWDEEYAAFRAEKAFIDADNARIAKEIELNDRFAAELAALEREKEAEIQAALKTGANVSLITKKYAAIGVQIEREKQKAKLDIIASFAGSLAELFGKETKLGKAAAIVQTVINTYKGAMAAFAETPGGIVIKSVAAGTAIATGVAAVRNIVKAGGGGGSASIPDIAGAGSSGGGLAGAPAPNYVTPVSAPQTVLVLEEFQLVQDTSVKVKNAGEL